MCHKDIVIVSRLSESAYIIGIEVQRIHIR